MLDGVYNENFFLRNKDKSIYKKENFIKNHMRLT